MVRCAGVAVAARGRQDACGHLPGFWEHGDRCRVVIWQSFREGRCPACSAHCALARFAERWEVLKAISNGELKS